MESDPPGKNLTNKSVVASVLNVKHLLANPKDNSVEQEKNRYIEAIEFHWEQEENIKIQEINRKLEKIRRRRRQRNGRPYSS